MKVLRETYISKSLKEHRRKRSLTLREVSEGTGLSAQNISRWERGDVLPNVEFCIRLADYYNVTLDDLIGRQRPEK